MDAHSLGDRSDAAERRQKITAEIVARTGIDEAMIERLVRAFYAKVRTEDLLGPIFEARVRDWDAHLQRMCAFWSSVALTTGRYHGTPMAKHLPLPVNAEHFDRWLALFETTAREVCPPEAAQHFIERTRRIAESLELGIAGMHGVRLGRDERFRRAINPVHSGAAATISSIEQILDNEKEPAMAGTRRNERPLGAAPEASPSSLLPMLISGLVLIVIGMIAVAAFT